MKKHITQILGDKGYKTYRKGFVFPDQNASAKEQYKSIMKRNDLIFIEGNKTTEEAIFYYPFGNILKINDFSCMIVGGIDIHFVKDEDFENKIVWGLREHGKPPTLIWPRPKITVKRIREYDGENIIVTENEIFDDSMNLCLSKENHNDILKALNNPDIVFNYDLTLQQD